VQRRLIEELGIGRLLAVVGGSLGGHMVFTWATRFPDRVAGAITLATSARLTSQALAFDVVGRNAILQDPAYQAGEYYENGGRPTVGLAQRLHARVGSRKGLPHKFKIGIAGCLNGCTKPNENDLGVMGRAKGFTVFVGGKMGKHPRWADILPLDIANEDRLFEVVESVIDWFATEGTAGERFGATIDRVGLEKLVQHLCRT
jgi:dissimilatory sulfite reductase (desulfoviridin) alpha/beta subunit